MNEKQSIDKYIRSSFSVIIGNFIYALSVQLFLIPSGLVTGGTTGLALMINHIWEYRSQCLYWFSTLSCSRSVSLLLERVLL